MAPLTQLRFQLCHKTNIFPLEDILPFLISVVGMAAETEPSLRARMSRASVPRAKPKVPEV